MMQQTPTASLEDLDARYPPNEAVTSRLDRMFYPKTVAVVGASHNPMKWGQRVIQSMLAVPFEGRIYPVNPKGGRILGLDVVCRLQDIPEPVDLVLVAVPPDKVMAVLRECVALDVGAVFVITAGFSEADRSALSVEEEMHRLVSSAKIPLGGPNGQGITCTQARLCAQMFPIMPPTGKISLVTQSGNVGVSMAHMAVYHNIGISKTISAGNEASLTTPDYLDYLARDRDTEVVAVYLEGADDGRRLLASLRRVALQKPVVVLKSGRTQFGAKAAVSHTGSLAGEDRIYDAAFRQAGVVRVYDLEELFDTVSAFAAMPLPRGNRLAVVTMGGGWGVLASDAAADAGLDLARLPDRVRTALDEMLPPRWSKGNPIDFVAAEGPDTLVKTLDLLLAGQEYDVLAVLGVGHQTLAVHLVKESALGKLDLVRRGAEWLMGEDRRKMEAVLSRIQTTDRPIVLASDAALSANSIGNQALEVFRSAGYPVYTSPERALRALGHLVRYAAWRRRTAEQR